MSESSSSARIRSNPARARGEKPCRAAAGFTLLEILIAFTILSLALVAAMQVFSTSLRGANVAEDAGIAVLHARSKMDEIGTAIPLVPGRAGGVLTHDFRWQASIEPFPGAYPGAGGNLPLMPYQVTVTVSWGRAQAVTLQTVKLGAAEMRVGR